MKQIETIKSGKNFSAVSVGKMSEIIEHVLPMGPNVTIQVRSSQVRPLAQRVAN